MRVNFRLAEGEAAEVLDAIQRANATGGHWTLSSWYREAGLARARGLKTE